MKNNKREIKSIDSKDELGMCNERRLEDLLKISNRYVRTQRHLEQNSNITDLDQLKHSFKIQEEREQRMDNLKNIIAYGIHENVDAVENLKRNIEFTSHYLQHHASHMDEETLESTIKKQEHRKEQLDFLD
jgi:hypothetical protein